MGLGSFGLKPLIDSLAVCLSCSKMSCHSSQRSKSRRAAIWPLLRRGCGFCPATLPYRPVATMLVVLGGFSVSTEELWSTGRVAVGFWVTSMPLSLIAQRTLERLLLVRNFFQICASKQSCLRALQIIPLRLCLLCTLTVNSRNL